MNACLGCGKDTELYYHDKPMCPECTQANETEFLENGPFKSRKPSENPPADSGTQI
jgi:hypothetical protein